MLTTNARGVRSLTLVLLLAYLATPAYSEDRPLSIQTPATVMSQYVSREDRSLDLKAAIRQSLVASMAEVNGLEGRRVGTGGQPLMLPPPQQGLKNWIQRHPTWFGALVGFGVGCPIGAAQVGGSQDNFFNTLDEFACPFLGGIGALIGAAIGSAISR